MSASFYSFFVIKTGHVVNSLYEWWFSKITLERDTRVIFCSISLKARGPWSQTGRLSFEVEKKSLKLLIHRKKQNNQLLIIDSWKILYHDYGLKMLHSYRIKKRVFFGGFRKKLMHEDLAIPSTILQAVIKLTDFPTLILYTFGELWQFLWYEIYLLKFTYLNMKFT